MFNHSTTPVANLNEPLLPSLIGTAILPTLVYGVNLTLVFITLRLMWKGRTADTQMRTLLMACYIAFLCVPCTAHWALSCVSEVFSLVDSEFSGPSWWNLVWAAAAADVTFAVPIIYTILTWLTDGLLVRVDV